MKTVLKIAIVCLVLVTLAVLAACGGAETTAPQTTTEPNTQTTTTEPNTQTTTEVITKAEVVVDGVTDYVIVYDATNETIKSEVSSYVSKMKSKFGITIKAEDVYDVLEPYAHEIIVGDVGAFRESVNAVKAKCSAGGDFAISVQNDDVVLYATDDANYKYLFAALLEEDGLKPDNKNLTYTSENDFYFHASDLKDMNYLEYKSQGKTMNGALVKTMFTYHEINKQSGGKLSYRLYIPSNYDPEKEYPLLVVLHGAGERGNDNERQFDNLVLDLFRQKNSPIDNAIVLLPQCPNNNQWVDTPWANGNYSTANVAESDDLKAVMKIIEGLREDYTVDDNRIYAMGLSMGGFGTWDLLMRHGDVFAAGVPICGGADVSKAADLAKIPIRTFHGGSDTTVPFSGTRAMAAAIEAANPVDFEYVEFAGVGHDVWTRVGQDPSVLNWLFEQSMADRK